MTADGANAHLREIAPGASTMFIDQISELVERLFTGEHPDYQKADLKYHDLEHTLLATQCFVDLARGRVRHGEKPAFSAREFMLGYAAIMLHDTGYLKTRDDLEGSGAKYTATHVVRSCAMASALLPEIGCSPDEIEGILNAIRCTGLTSKIEQIDFRTGVERMIGCMVATADYLGQMADPNYPDKLNALFSEFEESNDFNQVPDGQRLFGSVKELMAKTGGFWTNFALPKLGEDYEGVYRCLAMPDGTNPYLKAVDKNLAIIAELAAA
jgi:hypothetical protein